MGIISDLIHKAYCYQNGIEDGDMTKSQDNALDEWCTDCKEYDHEKHNCPRFNMVIRSALQDADLHGACTEVAQDVPDTNVGDMVYRQDAIEQAKELFTLGGCYCDQPAIIGMLNALPSAESADKHLWFMIGETLVSESKKHITAEQAVEKIRQYMQEARMPSAEIERKTGRWERHYSRPNVYADLWWHCSVCGYKNDDQYAYRYHHYCPNCGAKMEVEHDES